MKQNIKLYKKIKTSNIICLPIDLLFLLKLETILIETLHNYFEVRYDLH